MIALIDIDETLARLQREIQKYARTHHGKHYEWNDFTQHLREDRDPTYRKIISQFLAVPDNSLLATPYPGVCTALGQLKKAGYQLHIASARKENLHDATEQWLTAHRIIPLVDAIHPRPDSLNSHDFKVDIARKIGATVAFDDTYKIAYYLAESGVMTYLLSKPWNKGTPRHANIRRAPSFASAVALHLKSASP